MLYVAHAQPATAQLGAIRCEFLSPGREVLVINKLTRIEVCELVQPEGEGEEQLRSVLEIPLWGTIACLQSIKLEGDSTSSLLILTTSLQLFSLRYDLTTSSTGPPSPQHVLTTSTSSLHDPFARLSEFQTILVHQSCIVVLAYNGVMRVIPLTSTMAEKEKKGSSKKRRTSELAPPSSGLDLSRGYNLRLPSLNVTSLIFLPSSASPSAPTTTAEEDQEEEEEEVEPPLQEHLPALASLSTSSAGRPMLCTYFLDLFNKELIDGPLGGEARTVGDAGAELLIPVEGAGIGEEEQEQERGLLVVGEESVVWVSLAAEGGGSDKDKEKDKGKGKGKRRASESSALSGAGASSSSSSTAAGGAGAGAGGIKCRLPVGQIQAWTQLTRSTYLLGDIYGQLLLLSLIRNPSSGKVSAIKSQELGDAASPTALVPLSSSKRLIYLASRFGDSQLIRLPMKGFFDEGEGKGEAMEVDDQDHQQGEEGGLELVQSFASLAPVLDAVVVDGEGGGPSHVVTCSGAYKGGSLRVVRQGVGLAELASLELEGIQRIWSLQRASRPQDPLLVLSFFNETQILSLTASDSGEEEIEEIELPSFSTDRATLLAANLEGGLIVQVTTEGASWGKETEEGGKWIDGEGKKITLAAAAEGGEDGEGKHILVALEGGVVVLLEAQRGQGLVEVGRTTLPNEIACLSLNIISGIPIASLALWTLNTVHLLAVPSLSELATQKVETSFLIRSVLVQRFEDGVVSLLVGGGDGSVSSWTVELRDGPAVQVVKGSEKSVSLGTKPIVMGGIKQKGATGDNVLVSSDRPTVISRSGDRLVYSSVNLKDITTFTSFSTSLYPSALALATPTNLLIGRISSIQRVDIRAIPLDEDEPRRIAHDPKSQSYGVVCLRRDVDRKTGVQSTRGSVKVFDEGTFEVLADIQLQLHEEGQSIALIRTAEDRSAFIIGTTFIDSAEPEPTKGRLLIVAEDGDSRTFKQVSETQIDGCPYALAAAGTGHVAAAINSKVTVYSIDSSTHYLTAEATWGGAFVAFNLVSVGASESTLLVGDALRSVTVLQLTTSPAYKLEETARDYEAHYMSAVEAVGDSAEDEFIGAETDLNLFTIRKEKATTTRSIVVDDTALAPRGVFHLGEMVSRFRRGSLVQQLGDSVGAASPRLVFATSAGSLGIVAELDAESSKLLSDLERNMRGVLEGFGGLKQEEFRSFKSERQKAPPAGFVDGNFVERFAELGPEDVERVMRGRGEFEGLIATKEQVLRVVEEMARMH